MINTFVFMDLESTGLPMYGNRPRATEVSLISVNRKQILSCNSEECIPRILNKISFVCNPRAMISDEVVDLTGLSNENLEHEPPFDQNKADLIKLFLQNCVSPICLIAHNGFKFDFPLLKKELAAFGDTIAADVLCADSLPAFKHINNISSDNVLNPMNDEIEGELCDEATHVEEWFLTLQSPYIKAFIKKKYQPNKLTPVTPFMNKNEACHSWYELNYSLSHVYQSLFCRAITKAHSAESDTVHLMQCCVKIGEPLLKYFDSEAKKLQDITAIR